MTTASTGGNIAAALRACAAGIHPAEAGTGLLIDSSCWLHREDFTSRFITADTSGDGIPMASIDWEAAISALQAGEMPCSSGERRILLLAASIAAGTPVSLFDALPGIDDRNAALVLQAIAHAAGQTWLSGSSLADLATLLATLDEFLRSPQVPAALTTFLGAAGQHDPGHFASLLIDELSFTALRIGQITGQRP